MHVTALVWLSAAAAAQTAIDVVGLDGRVTPVSLEGLTRASVTADDHGTRVRFEGVRIGDIIGKAGVELGDRLRARRSRAICS